MKSKEYYEGAVWRLQEFISDTSDMSDAEIRAELESEGLNVAASLSQLEEKLRSPSSNENSQGSGSAFKGPESGRKPLDSNEMLCRILQLLEEKGRDQQNLTWDLVHASHEWTRALIVKFLLGTLKESDIVETLVRFCNGTIRLLDNSLGHHTFQVSVTAFLSEDEMIRIATDDIALAAELRGEKVMRTPISKIPALISALLGPLNLYVRDNHIAVGIRQIQADRLKLPDLIGFLSVVCVTDQGCEPVFRQSQPIASVLKNMLFAYADLMYAILVLRTKIVPAQPISSRAEGKLDVVGLPFLESMETLQVKGMLQSRRNVEASNN